MRNLLLIMFAITVVYASNAQVPQLKPQKKFNTTVLKYQQPSMDEVSVFTGSNPLVANDRATDIVIGETWYDDQTNAAPAQRIYSYEDGTIATVWTRGMTPTDYTDRGTGYNYYDGSGWGPYPTERIEGSVRTGWPTYQPFLEDGEIVVAHTASSGLQFSWREHKGAGTWNYFLLAGPVAQPDLLWPRMLTSGENHEVIHVIAVAGNGATYEGLTMALLYSRSSDGGVTWEPENVVLTGMGSDDCAGWRGDSYAWAPPKGDTIAFVAFSGIADGIIMKSFDGGDTWERITFYESPDPFFDGNSGNLPQCGGGDGSNAIFLDENGMAHIAFGRQIHIDDTPDDDTWSYYPYTDGLIYWNETMEPLDTAKIGATILPEDWSTTYLYQHGHLAAWTQPNGEDTIIGVATYQMSLTSMPQMVYHDGLIQFFYAGLAIGFDNTIYNYRHIYGRFTEIDGYYSPFVDYTGDVFHLFSECVYPSVSPFITEGKYHILYQSDNLPGNSLMPADAPSQDPILNNMVYLTVSPLAVGVKENISTIAEVSQNFPNPFNGKTYVNVNLTEGSDLMLEVYSITGQKLAENNFGYINAGTQTLTIDASSFTTGVYFYTITANGQKVTQKMIVE